MVMRRVLLCIFALLLSSQILAQTKTNSDKQQYSAPDGSRAVVVPVGKEKGAETAESRVEIYSHANQRLCTLDYSSSDSEHGDGVAKAAWTPDGKYFVFSLVNSGGHQPYHTPTMFFSRQESQVCSLDDYLDEPIIGTPDFKLTAPNSITTWVYDAKSEVTLSLDSLPKRGKTKGAQHCLPCTHGVVHILGERAQ